MIPVHVVTSPIALLYILLFRGALKRSPNTRCSNEYEGLDQPVKVGTPQLARDDLMSSLCGGYKLYLSYPLFSFHPILN